MPAKNSWKLILRFLVALLGIAAVLGLNKFVAADPQIHNHIRTMSYFTSREIKDPTEAGFIANTFDINRSRSNYSSLLHQLNPNIWLTWGRNTRAIQDVSDFENWVVQNQINDFEDAFLHYKEDITLPGGLQVKGWRAECSPNCVPPATAATKKDSRVPNNIPGEISWMVPNPNFAPLQDFYAYTIHQRHQWYDNYEGVFWDWCAGAKVQNESLFSKTHEYWGIDDTNWFHHPFIASSINLITQTMNKYSQFYPNDPAMQYIPCNTIAPFWMYPRPAGEPPNDYRDAILNNPKITHLFMEVWLGFDEDGSPNNQPNDALIQKYLKDTVVLSQQKKMILQVMLYGDYASDREKMFLYSSELLVQNPNRFTLAYHLEGEAAPNSPNESVSNWLWFPAMGYDIGQPENNPAGTRDIFGNQNTSEFYEWIRGNNPGNTGQYVIYSRHYENALVLTKLRSVQGEAWDATTATTHQLPGTYRQLNADGSLGSPVNTITLKNNEGAVLIKTAGNSPPFLPPIQDKSVLEGETLQFTITAFDNDPGDILTFSSSPLPPGANLTDNHNRTATFSWTPINTQANIYDITITVSDDTDQMSQPFKITVLDNGTAGTCQIGSLITQACTCSGNLTQPDNQTFCCQTGILNPCDTNNDCNDGNAGTNDFCRNPGTCGAYCENTPPTLPPPPQSQCLDSDNDFYYGYSAICSDGLDCNDSNSGIKPGATEICGNGIDENCDGKDDACNPLPPICIDADKDGYDGKTAICETGNDCNDINVSVKPGASEICGNGVDENCDGIDETCGDPSDFTISVPQKVLRNEYFIATIANGRGLPVKGAKITYGDQIKISDDNGRGYLVAKNDITEIKVQYNGKLKTMTLNVETGVKLDKNTSIVMTIILIILFIMIVM